jgi:hypothetical protein
VLDVVEVMGAVSGGLAEQGWEGSCTGAGAAFGNYSRAHPQQTEEQALGSSICRICYGYYGSGGQGRGERTTCPSTASSLNLRRANGRHSLTHSQMAND